MEFFNRMGREPPLDTVPRMDAVTHRGIGISVERTLSTRMRVYEKPTTGTRRGMRLGIIDARKRAGSLRDAGRRDGTASQ